MKNIFADIITIGDEILIGQINDTNSTWIAAELNKNGFKVSRKTSVADDKEEIIAILNESLKRSDVVLITGGLGPTKDDITKKTLADYFGQSLELREEALEGVKAYFTKRGRPLNENGYQQATLPEKCRYIPNKLGTAPGMWFDYQKKVVISMPGVPSEMKGMMIDTILGSLKNHFETPDIVHKTIRTFGIGETDLSKIIASFEASLPEKIRLAYLPSLGSVRLRLSAYGGVTQSELNTYGDTLRQLVYDYYYADDATTLKLACAHALNNSELTISTAESCTGGYLAHLITSIPGSSAYFKGSILSYANEVKERELQVPHETLRKYGAVSEETVIAMAKGVCNKLHTDIGLATSGIAGPDGGTPEKPVGTIWIALAIKGEVITKKLQLGNTRVSNIQLTALSLLKMLLDALKKNN